MSLMVAGLAALAACRSPSSPSSGSSGSSSSALSITATWDITADIDLHVVEPSGVEIYWGNPGPTATSGVLSGDADQDCVTTSVGHKEVVQWPTSAPSGTYIVRLDDYQACSAALPTVNYTVTISDGKTTLPAITGSFVGMAGDVGAGGSGTTVKTFTHVGSTFSSLWDTAPPLLFALKNVYWSFPSRAVRWPRG